MEEIPDKFEINKNEINIQKEKIEEEFDLNLFDLIKKSQIKKNLSVSRAFNKTLNKYAKNKYVNVNHPCKIIKNDVKHFNLNDFTILKTIYDNDYLKVQVVENCKSMKKFVMKVYSKRYIISKKITNQVFHEIVNSNSFGNDFITKFEGMTQNNKLIFLLYEFDDVCKTLYDFICDISCSSLVECQ